MNSEIHLNNPYFPWTKTEDNNINCWLKGDLYLNNKILKGSDIISLFSKISTPSKNVDIALKDLLLQFNGSFAIVIETPENIFCIVDRVRSIPLFYTKTNQNFTISDDGNYLRDQFNPPFNEINGAEFLVTGYVTGSETLFEGIQQIQAGEYLVYRKNDSAIMTSFYYRFWHDNYYTTPEDVILSNLDEVFLHVFQRLILSTKNKGLQIVVPLSGGLDSRIIVAMLKRLGVEDVICFSYGKKGNREAKISQQVAEALGYQWYFVEYTSEILYDLYHSDIIYEYNKYAGNLVSLPHIQDFIAVMTLKAEGKILNHAVFLPGHCGDFLAGTYIPSDCHKLPNYSLENFVNETIKIHYSLWNWDKDNEDHSFFNEKIIQTTNQIQINDRESYVNQVLLFVFNEKVAKFVVNSVRLYEFFGDSWRIPLWDNELINFFSKVPLNYRIDEYLYIKYAKELLFINNLQQLQEIECTTTLSNKISVRFPILQRAITYFKTITSLSSGWAYTQKYPLICKIHDKLLGHPIERQFSNKHVKRILDYTHKCKVIPTGNGLLTEEYLYTIYSKIV